MIAAAIANLQQFAMVNHASTEPKTLRESDSTGFGIMETIAQGKAGVTWDASVSAFNAATQELQAFQRDVWGPAIAWCRRQGGTIYQGLEGEMKRLADAYLNAEQTLFATPAPDAEAVARKLDHLRTQIVDTGLWSPEWLDEIKADLENL